MKVKELREKNSKELYKLLKEEYEKLRKYRFELSRKELKNNDLIKITKRQIAKIWTILREKYE